MKDFKKNNQFLGILLTVPVAIATIVGCAFAALTFISPRTTIYILEKVYPESISTPEIIYQTIIAQIEVTKIVSTTPLPYTATPDNTSTASITPTETATPTPTNTPIPTPVLLFQTHFNEGVFPTDWIIQTTNVKPTINDGVFVVDSTFTFAIGDENWQNYRVSIDFANQQACNARIGVRGDKVILNICYGGYKSYLLVDGRGVPDSGYNWQGSGVFEFTADGDHYKYFGRDIISQGFPNGNVVITLSGGSRVKEIKVIQLQ